MDKRQADAFIWGLLIGAGIWPVAMVIAGLVLYLSGVRT